MDDPITAAVRAAYLDAARECHRMAESYTRSLSHYAEDDPEWRKIKYAAAAVTVAAENIMTLARADEVAQGGAERVQHIKRGSTYRVIGRGKVQTDVALGDYAEVVIYQGEADGLIWVRPVSEFEDGRFAPLPPPPKGGEG